MITIEFVDKGQDFLEWDIDTETGKVLDCRPYQAAIWTRKYVFNPKGLKPGSEVIISDGPITDFDDDAPILLMKYKVKSIKEV